MVCVAVSGPLLLIDLPSRFLIFDRYFRFAGNDVFHRPTNFSFGRILHPPYSERSNDMSPYAVCNPWQKRFGSFKIMRLIRRQMKAGWISLIAKFSLALVQQPTANDVLVECTASANGRVSSGPSKLRMLLMRS
jgi:hypothetical protein